ncbi:MAG: hypothetical protein HY551_04585 [Elusimicrobia bacterium]|nr:hypothetical protein [Elusimicrobiota bacterium]
MYTHDDLIDAILEDISSLERRSVFLPKTSESRSGAGPRGRPFLTEAEIKKALTPGTQHLTIPRDAIVSPLALDWLALRGIHIVRE